MTSPPGRATAARALNVPASEALPVIFADPASMAAQALLDRLAPTDATLLIIGETGTGKEMAARYVHANSRRRSGPFLAVNCGALSDTLAEAELFGHEKGAFTGAIKSQPGWFEAANGGTLLLDEIGDLPLQLQVKLLRVLQEREVTRVGSRRAVPIDVRIIAATNVDLGTAISEKKFREDLYFRLNVATIILPALRDRKAGLPMLIAHFLKLYGDRLGRPHVAFSPGALALLLEYGWPGNIRELENVVYNAVLLAPNDLIERAQLQLTHRAATPDDTTPSQPVLRMVLERSMRDREAHLFDRVTRTMVQTAFDLADGNQVHAAEYLGISRNMLRTHLARLGILPPRRRQPGLAAPRPQSRPAFPRKILRIGYQKFGILGVLRAQKTLESGLLAQQAEVTWTEFPAGPQLLAAMDAGQIDFGTTGEVPPIFAQAEGSELRYVAYEPPAPRGVAIVVRRDSPIESLAGLRGRRIVFNKASNVQYLLVRGLEAHGLSLSDIEVVYSSAADPPATIRANDADAWVLWDPFLTMALRSGEIRLLLDGQGLVMNHHFHLASRALSQDAPAMIQALTEEIRMVGRRTVQNPRTAAQELSLRLGIDVPALEIAFSRLSHGAAPLDQPVIWEQQNIADRFYALGLIKRPIRVRDAVLENMA
jgi:DNA-binding NtrC family response regulator/ABC-type nitrate/sulfonate/bicarbonate transport system substrate-binding protein